MCSMFSETSVAAGEISRDFIRDCEGAFPAAAVTVQRDINLLTK
jgi:hypothetical protein